MQESRREHHRDRLATAVPGFVLQGIIQASIRNIRLLDDGLRAPSGLVVG